MADVSFRTDGIKQKPLKILVIGDMHVGKSSLLLRFVRNAFNPNIRATIGVDYLLKTLTIDKVDYLFQIWDTGTPPPIEIKLHVAPLTPDAAGHERFRAITTSYYRTADGVILVYDCTVPFPFSLFRRAVASLS
jgi:GTPase SAR1 family protein